LHSNQLHSFQFSDVYLMPASCSACKPHLYLLGVKPAAVELQVHLWIVTCTVSEPQ
jgi:hypothetical protein